jgi:hypothetical protein
MKILLPAVLLVVATVLSPVTMAAETDPPRDFLPATSKRLQNVLAIPISADFKNTPLLEAIDVLAKKYELNFAVAVGGPDGSTPNLTAHFEHTPLREALFKISRELNVKVEWLYLFRRIRTRLARSASTIDEERPFAFACGRTCRA